MWKDGAFKNVAHINTVELVVSMVFFLFTKYTAYNTSLKTHL